MEVTFIWNGWAFFANVAADGAVTNVSTEHNGRIIEGGLDGLSSEDAEAVCAAARAEAKLERKYNRIRYDYETQAIVRYDFLCRDRLGREIGAQVTVATATVQPPAEDGSYRGSYTTLEPGTYLSVRFSATRNGSSYGASQRWTEYETQEQVDAEIARYLKAAQKRAVKKAAVVHGEGIQIRM